VITYARKNLDVPPPGKESKPPGLSPAALYRAFRMYTRGLKSLAVNAQARALEAERMGDVIFLLSYIRQEHPGDPVFSGIPTGAVFIAGYGIGGGALVRLAGSPGFTQTNPGVKGIIAIESPVFSAFTGEDPPPPQAAGGDESRLRSLWTGITRWFSRWKRQKITGLGVIPRPEVPALYMVSDRALTPRHREDRYAAIFTLLLGSRAPAVLAAIPGAGPLDYSDIPQKFPLYRLFFPGKRFTLGESRDFIRETAGLITNFAALFEDNLKDNPKDYLPAIRRENLSKDIYLESGGAWNFLYSRDILEP
jgi:hypothetical protein